MPMRTLASGKFTGVQFPACEDCRSMFPCEIEMSVGPSMTFRVHDAFTERLRLKEGLPGLSPGVL